MNRTRAIREPMVVIDAAAGSAPSAAGHWFVLHTRSRQEKALSADLTSQGISHFLPLLHRVRRYGRRTASSDVPMFPGYLFLKGTVEQAYAADRSPRVAKLISVEDQQRLQWELEQIDFAVSHGAPLEAVGYLEQGTRVEVRTGPFRGLQGVVERLSGRGGDQRLILQVRMLGRAMALELDGAIVERVG